MRSLLWQVILLAFTTFHINANSLSVDSVRHAIPEQALYKSISWPKDKPEYEVFYSAISGYQLLQDSLQLFKKPIITIVDFSKPSTDKRLWVINLENKEVLMNTLVAHGRNSGEVMATRFSNKHESFQSSLGFYVTGNTYIGKHGLSLILQGLEGGINDQASKRAIVVHGANYVSEQYVKFAGRLGRSQGCPAVSMEVYRQLITAIKDQTCLFIYSPTPDYLQQSKILPKQPREETFAFHPSEIVEWHQ